MRALFPLALASLGLGLCACTTVEAPPHGTPPSAPEPVPAYDWNLHIDGEQAGLAYGVDESDDVWLILDCERGSGRIRMTQPVADEHPAVISVESGGDTEAWQADAEPSELHNGVFLIADGSASSPVFLRFRRLGWMAIYGPGYRTPMVAHPASGPRIERFFDFCG